MNNNVVSGFCNFSDGGTSFTFNYPHVSALKYFCEAGVDTCHYIYGSMTVAAYKAKDSNRPAVS
ncbi:unnamed protein product, partial [Mucor circinelloides]